MSTTPRPLPSPPETAAIASSLARFGLKVFPVKVTTFEDEKGQAKRGKFPQVKSFPVDATDDPGVVYEWWAANPELWIGIYVGGSGVIALDVDREPDDGFSSLKAHGLKPPKTLHYDTLGGGRHYLYRAPAGVDATNAQGLMHDGSRMAGVDVRGGNGYVVYYGDALTEEPALAKAPGWAIVERNFVAAHSLDLDKWLKSLAKGTPTRKALKVVDRVTSTGMSHDDLLGVTKDLAELGSLGKPGIRKAIKSARAKYVEKFPEYAKTFDDALLGSANFWGMPLDTFSVPKGKRPKGEPGKDLATVENPGHVATPPRPVAEVMAASDPDDFIDKKNGIDPEALGDHVDLGDLAIGADRLFWVYRGGVWDADDDEVMKRVVLTMKNRYRREHVGLARDVVFSKPGLTRLSNEPISEFMNLENGMYEWRTGVLHDHAPSYASTTRLSITFDAMADCPTFEAWLAEVASPDVAQVVWELIAYSMLSGNPFQKAAALVGPGGTGKGTLIRLIEHMAGARNISHLTPEAMAGTFEPATMLGKLLNTVGDLKARFLPDTAAFKNVTGGDMITVQNKNKPLFDFRPWCFPIFGMNEIATSGDVTSGYFRRWVIVPFDRPVDRTRPFDESALQAEANGIFMKAMTYLPTIIAQNGFTETIETEAARAKFERESDSIRTWLDDDEHIVEADPSMIHAKTSRPYLYGVYAQWCKDTGHGRPTSRPKLAKRLEALGFDTIKVQGTIFVRGIAVDSEPLTGAQDRPHFNGYGYFPDELDP